MWTFSLSRTTFEQDQTGVTLHSPQNAFTLPGTGFTMTRLPDEHGLPYGCLQPHGQMFPGLRGTVNVGPAELMHPQVFLDCIACPLAGAMKPATIFLFLHRHGVLYKSVKWDRHSVETDTV